MKALSHILLVLVFTSLIISCEKKDEESKLQGSVYGTITDKATGEPIKSAGVELRPDGLRAVTGDNGGYEFVNIESGTYDLYVTKNGYNDSKISGIRINGNDKDKKVDVQLEKLPPALTILDESGNKINIIDFGIDEGVTMRLFNIFNDSEDILEWEIAFDCKWIKFSKDKGELKANAIQSVSITIDRSKLDIGQNVTIVHILSNNGSKQLTVKATSLSVIETKDATDIDSHSAILNANVVRNMTPSINEYGFVYSKTSTPTLTNGARKISNVGTPQIGVYGMKVDSLEKEVDYYVRAFVKNDEKELYGKQIVFHTISHKPEILLLNTSSIKSTATTIYGISCRTNNGGLPLEGIYICWSEERLPTKDGNIQKIGETSQSEPATIKGLKPLTTYYIRAYTKNAEEEDYSDEFSITTKDGKPIVGTIKEYSYGANYLTLSGTSTSPDNIPLIRQGICYSKTQSLPTLNDSFVTSDNLISPFTCQLSNLEGCTSYYYRAFAENEYDISYSNEVYTAKTACNPATLKGYVYDQDGNPIKNAKVGVGKTDGTYNDDYSMYSNLTNAQGYYEISFPVNNSNKWVILATADNFEYHTKDIVINTEQVHQLDFTLSYIKKCDVDLGTGYWADGPSYLLFSCNQSSLAGKTTTRNMRLRNYRSVPVDWSITNVPSVGVKLSQYKGTIPANGEISVVWTFTYPTTSATAVSLTGCASGSRAYVWNWESVAGGVYIYEIGIVSSSYPYNKVGVDWELGYNSCSAACEQGIFLNIGDEQGGFSLAFSQFVTYK